MICSEYVLCIEDQQKPFKNEKNDAEKNVQAEKPDLQR